MSVEQSDGTTTPHDALALGKAFTPEKPRGRATKQLYRLLVTLVVSDDPWARLTWIEQLAAYIHRGAKLGTPGSVEDPRTQRLRLFVRALNGVPEWHAAFAKNMEAMLAEAHGVRVFSDIGLPGEAGFVSEMIDRWTQKFLPSAPQPKRLSHILIAAFPKPDDARWLASAPRSVLAEFIALFRFEATGADPGDFVRASMTEASRVLAARVCAQGLAQDLRDRLPDVHVRSLPFLRLPRTCDALALDASGRPTTVDDAAMREVQAVIGECRGAVESIHEHIEQFGVSVDIVYRLELITAQLGRLEELLGLLIPGFVAKRDDDLPKLMASLVQAQFDNRSVRALVQQNSRRLAQKIIERAGHSGEHYITETRREWILMLLSAAGGGILTAGTAALKFLISGAPLAPVWLGLGFWINYAGSFLIMQLCGFTLATKQPSMTAAALAASLGQHAGIASIDSTQARRLDRLVDMISRITRSQFAAAIGNVGFVVPTAIAFDWYYRLRHGHHFLDAHQAEHMVALVSLRHGYAPPFAALTGVCLWLSSVGAGWFENWVVYRRLPDAIAHHRLLNRIFGRERCERLAQRMLHAVSGIGGNVSLGFFLAVTPLFASAFGIHVEVPHVTLSSGALAFSGCTLGIHAVREPAFLWAIAGIGVIGLLNFGVSFVLALLVALRARDVHAADVFILMRTVISRALRAPWTFLLPPGGAAAPATPAIANTRRAH